MLSPNWQTFDEYSIIPIKINKNNINRRYILVLLELIGSKSF
jgi:hypothetical protein